MDTETGKIERDSATEVVARDSASRARISLHQAQRALEEGAKALAYLNAEDVGSAVSHMERCVEFAHAAARNRVQAEETLQQIADRIGDAPRDTQTVIADAALWTGSAQVAADAAERVSTSVAGMYEGMRVGPEFVFGLINGGEPGPDYGELGADEDDVFSTGIVFRNDDAGGISDE